MTTLMLLCAFVFVDDHSSEHKSDSFQKSVAHVKQGCESDQAFLCTHWKGYVCFDRNEVGSLYIKTEFKTPRPQKIEMAHVKYEAKEYFQPGQLVEVAGECKFKDGEFQIEAKSIKAVRSF